jgi:hypothetical protein
MAVRHWWWQLVSAAFASLRVQSVLTKHHDHLRLALREAQRSAVTPAH